MAGMFFFQLVWPTESLLAGDVVVEAPKGVALERWTPVFIYASLSKHTYSISCPLSHAPDSAWIPISKVAPSPPIPTDFTRLGGLLPFLWSVFHPDSTPDAQRQNSQIVYVSR